MPDRTRRFVVIGPAAVYPHFLADDPTTGQVYCHSTFAEVIPCLTQAPLLPASAALRLSGDPLLHGSARLLEPAILHQLAAVGMQQWMHVDAKRGTPLQLRSWMVDACDRLTAGNPEAAWLRFWVKYVLGHCQMPTIQARDFIGIPAAGK